MDKLRFAVRFSGRTIMPKSLKPLRIGRLRKEFLLCRNIRWKSIGVVWRNVIDLNIHGLFVLGSFATRWLLPLGKVPPLSPAKSGFPVPARSIRVCSLGNRGVASLVPHRRRGIGPPRRPPPYL